MRRLPSGPEILSLLLNTAPAHTRSVVSGARLFFVVGMGRSGTTSLQRLLNDADGCRAYHESRGDRAALVRAYWQPDEADLHLASRERLIAARVLLSQCHTYGEVNSYLRYHVDALQRRWDCTILHLVRDGRDVVRSIMNRRAFSPAETDHTSMLSPHPDDPLAHRWPELGRFERVCWYWSWTTHFLLERRLPLVRLEDIMSSYGCFNQQVLEPLGVDLSSDVWRSHVSRPANASKETGFPSWCSWSPVQKRQFESICGPTMAELGYSC